MRRRTLEYLEPCLPNSIQQALCPSNRHQVKTSRTFLRDAGTATPLALALLGSGTLDVVHEGGYATLGGWLRLRAPAQVERGWMLDAFRAHSEDTGQCPSVREPCKGRMPPWAPIQRGLLGAFRRALSVAGFSSVFVAEAVGWRSGHIVTSPG